jgi:pyruvate dehydrogenase E2 component (dihydrolipoamide acetyltransferase)
MATKVIMPKLGLAMAEGVVVKWLKEDGAQVEKGQRVAMVMSKKITYAVEAPASGVLRHAVRIKAAQPVGAAIAYILAPGEEMPVEVAAPPPVETMPGAAALAPPPAEAKEEQPFVLASPAARRLARERGVELAEVQGTGRGGRVTEADVLHFVEEREKAPPPPVILASPMARRLAEEHGVDLAQVTGTGSGGRITEKDVLAFVEAREKAPAPAAAPPARVIPFIGMRQMIAERMTQSLQTTAQVTIHTEVDATELVRLREQLKAEFDLTYTDLLIKAVAKALQVHPSLNATLVGDEIHVLGEIHIGMAVALEDGLLVPVVRDADQRSLQEIAQETRRLAEGARKGTLTVDEVTGSTFTITNLGGYGADGFTPIINPPEAAILGVGRIADKPAVHDGQIVRRSIMVLSLTIDHRIVDGAPGAEFLRTVRQFLESPYRLCI